MSTRESKSLTFILISRLLSTTITIVVVPTIVLIANLTHHCIEYSIAYIEWEKEPDLNVYILNKPNLLFVSIEGASIQTFRDLLSYLSSSEALNQIMFNEAYLIIIAQEYYSSIQLLWNLYKFYTQIIFLTATLPPFIQAMFLK